MGWGWGGGGGMARGGGGGCKHQMRGAPIYLYKSAGPVYMVRRGAVSTPDLRWDIKFVCKKKKTVKARGPSEKRALGSFPVCSCACVCVRACVRASVRAWNRACEIV